MSSILQVVFFSLIGGVLSLIGGMLLLSSKKRAKTLALYATPFAAGALLAAAFTDLLSEGAAIGGAETTLRYALVGILLFFVLERFLYWFHHHHSDEHNHTDPDVPLIIIGDTLHNFIDGIAIGAGFLVDPTTGIVVTLAVAAHEIPQEIGDFGLLISKGMDRAKVLWVNVLSALATTVAAVGFFQLGREVSLAPVLGLAAGFFIYIAVSDIIPTIHHQKSDKIAAYQTGLLVFGLVAVASLTTFLHQYIDQGHGHESQQAAEHNDEHEHEAHSHELYEYEDHATLPAVELLVEKDSKSGWNVELELENFVFAPESVNEENVPGEGHAHLYVNDIQVARLYSPFYHIGDLGEGDEVRVTLNTNDHSEYAHDGVVIGATEDVGYVEGDRGHEDHDNDKHSHE